MSTIKILLVILLCIFILYNLYFAFIKIEPFNETILIEDTIYGKMKCFKGDKIICGSLINNKSWEPHILDILKKIIKKTQIS
jgi:hypothetical protein